MTILHALLAIASGRLVGFSPGLVGGGGPADRDTGRPIPYSPRRRQIMRGEWRCPGN
jgi:hypothetical protein